MDAHRVWLDTSIEVVLDVTEYEVLAYLWQNRGHIVLKDTLLQEVWGDANVADHTLQVVINRLRVKIGSETITTRRNFGYGIL